MSADPGGTTGADPEGGGGGGGGVATPPFKSKPYLPGCTFAIILIINRAGNRLRF